MMRKEEDYRVEPKVVVLNTVSKNLKEICEITDMSYVELAKRATISYSAMRSIIHMKHIPQLITLSLIATALGLTLEQLCSPNAAELFTAVKPKVVDRNVVAKNIEDICKSRNISYNQVSKMAGISSPTIYHIIHTNFKTKLSTLTAIADALGLTLEQLCSPITKEQLESLKFIS